MCAARRTTSTRLTRLAAKANHGSVTLHEAAKDSIAPAGLSTSVRRSDSSRVKHEPTDAEFAIEDVVPQGRTVVAKTQSSKRVKTETQDETPKKRKKPASKAKAVAQPLDVPHPTPDKWAEAYAAIKEMRSRVVAPVDTMGCEQAQVGEQDPKNQRFSTLVSLMLSSQTRDEVTNAAVQNLRAAFGGSLSLAAVLEADETTISDAIAKVGFWRRKTQYIKQTAKRLHDEFDADVPNTVEALCSLPGVGPKMAYLALQIAWNLNVGIGVDVHVHRITNRLGWHVPPTKNPEETRVNLESWLPKELHGKINHLLVGFGQTLCLPVGPKCGECTLSTGGLCPSAHSARTKTAKKAARSSRGVAEGSGPKIEIEIEPPKDRELAILAREK